jgi:hypothetical protein
MKAGIQASIRIQADNGMVLFVTVAFLTWRPGVSPCQVLGIAANQYLAVRLDSDALGIIELAGEVDLDSARAGSHGMGIHFRTIEGCHGLVL